MKYVQSFLANRSKYADSFLANRSKKAFTLIELLVVIAIISILAGILFTTIGQGPLRQARDVKRRSDARELQKAIERYGVDNGVYPSTGGSWWANCPDYGSHPISGATGYIPNLAPSYVSSLPLDPKPVSTFGCYLYLSDGTNYKLLIHQTMEMNCPPMPANEQMYDPARSGSQCSIAVYSSGASGW